MDKLEAINTELVQACKVNRALIEVIMRFIGNNPDCGMSITKSMQAAYILSTEAIRKAKQA